MINSSEYIISGRPLKDYTYKELADMIKWCRKVVKSKEFDSESNLIEMINQCNAELIHRDSEIGVFKCAGTGGYYPEYSMNWKQKLILILGLN